MKRPENTEAGDLIVIELASLQVAIPPAASSFPALQAPIAISGERARNRRNQRGSSAGWQLENRAFRDVFVGLRIAVHELAAIQLGAVLRYAAQVIRVVGRRP